MAGEPVRMCPTVEELPEGWQVKRLGSFCTKIGTGATPRGGSEVYLNSRISHALVRSQHVFDRHFDTAGLAFISDNHAKELRNAEVQSGDVLLNITGDGVTFGRSCIVPERVLPACVNQHVSIIRPNRRECDPGYLLSVLTHPATKGYIESFNSGGSRRAITKGHIESFEIPLPPLAEQKAIAAVLGALDDKIELNRRMNATLEAMARALFQSWFVDFDPVRAKLDTRQPVAMDPATAALFPVHLEDSPLGHIPKGWKAGTVVEGFNLMMGQSPPGDTYNEEENGLPFYQGRTDFGFRFPTRRIYCSAPTRYAKPGDTLVSVRAPVGDINMANEECCIGRGIAAVRHKSGATSFTYHSMANLYPDFARFEAEGTVFGSINKDSFEKLRFVIPPDEIIAAYERQAGPLDEQIRTLETQSRTLATLRDTLLPKLLSGQLSVPIVTVKP
jgi:type I restriction enzyme S subunit